MKKFKDFCFKILNFLLFPIRIVIKAILMGGSKLRWR